MKTYLPVAVLVLLVVAGGMYLYGPKHLNPAPAAVNNLSADVYPLYNGLVWGAEEATTSSSFVGYIVESQTISNISNLSAISTPFDEYYKNKLLALGWSPDITLEAGGPGAEVMAYKKGDTRIIIAYHTVFHGGGANEPVKCPCDITFSIFSGGPVSAEYKDAVYFGNEAVGDLNGDGVPDVAFIFTQSGGGSGTFYYVVAALKEVQGYQGTNAVLLGDRIAPQTTEIKDGQLIVNYADRKPNEPMTAQPSVGVSKYLRVQGTTLVAQ